MEAVIDTARQDGTGGEATAGSVPCRKVLVADDHAVFREGLRVLMQARGFADTVLEAPDADAARDILAANGDIDLAVLDLFMPGMEHFAFLKQLRGERPELAIVVLTASERLHDLRGAMDAGATGYIPKSFTITEVLSALQRIVDGEAFFPTGTLDDGSGDAAAGPALSPRQTEVLSLIAQGYSNKEIARKLDTALPTIKNHVANIFEKLGASNRVAAVNIGRRSGLIPDE
ncbi:response regulator [Novispirillum sp. DQ9]|uniref:response regulator transcription factor n=1 Tax=Novispirillum sp. DQ9 TaxID=3398612 RepID=UPI003C7B45DB